MDRVSGGYASEGSVNVRRLGGCFIWRKQRSSAASRLAIAWFIQSARSRAAASSRVNCIFLIFGINVDQKINGVLCGGREGVLDTEQLIRAQCGALCCGFSAE